MKALIRDVETHFEKIGKGPSLILLHGWGNTWESWSSVIAQLSTQYQLILPDLPSFGTSDTPKDVWNTQAYTHWLDQFIQEVVKDAAYSLVGHSFGGKIASVFAAHYHPKNLQHLVIVDASGLPDPLPIQHVLQKRMLGFIPSHLKDLISDETKQKLLKINNSSTDYLNANAYQKDVLKLILPENIAKDLIKITTPTTIIWGESDTETPLHQGEAFHKYIPHSTFHALDTGHFPFIEKPKEFINILEKALQ